jgi:hypothetical protein
VKNLQGNALARYKFFAERNLADVVYFDSPGDRTPWE